MTRGDLTCVNNCPVELGPSEPHTHLGRIFLHIPLLLFGVTICSGSCVTTAQLVCAESELASPEPGSEPGLRPGPAMGLPFPEHTLRIH